MLIEEAKGADRERTVLIAGITSAVFLSRVIGKVDKEPFKSKFANVIWGWCCEHYNKYRTAPARVLETLFSEYAGRESDRETLASIQRLLASLSGEYEKVSAGVDLEFVLDLAQRHFNDVRLYKLSEELSAGLERGDTDWTLEKAQGFRKVDLRTEKALDVLGDEEAQRRAFENKQKALIKYPGAARMFFGTEFAEDSLVAFMAPPGGMKSYTLLDAAWRAMLQGRQVAYFQAGDLTEGQIIRRFLRRAAYRPITAKTIKFPVGIVLPVGGPKEPAMVDRQERVYARDISWDTARRAFLGITQKTGGRIKLLHRPVKSLTARDMANMLEGWDREGWRAEVVVCDYAGNLAFENNKDNPINQTANTWATLRQISEARNCCVITANQSNKESFKTWVLTRSHFRDSLMVLAHPTCFMGISMTDEEKSRGVVRYNFVKRREEGFVESDCLYAGSCLDIANPIVVSILP